MSGRSSVTRGARAAAGLSVSCLLMRRCDDGVALRTGVVCGNGGDRENQQDKCADEGRYAGPIRLIPAHHQSSLSHFVPPARATRDAYHPRHRDARHPYLRDAVHPTTVTPPTRTTVRNPRSRAGGRWRHGGVGGRRHGRASGWWPGNTFFRSLMPRWVVRIGPKTSRKSVVTARSRPS